MVSMSTELLLATRDLAIGYPTKPCRRVAKGISVSLPPGELICLLGPNGAGKSTLMGAIAGLLELDSGRIEVFGLDPLRDRTQVREVLGVQLQESRFQDRVKVREVVANDLIGEQLLPVDRAAHVEYLNGTAGD